MTGAVGSTYPTAEWIANQLTDAFPWDEAPQHLIRGRDGAYGLAYMCRIHAMGIRDHPTAPRSPWQNGHVERLIGSIRRECLDHFVLHVGESFGVGVQVRPLENTLHQDVSLHLPRSVHRVPPTARGTLRQPTPRSRMTPDCRRGFWSMYAPDSSHGRRSKLKTGLRQQLIVPSRKTPARAT